MMKRNPLQKRTGGPRNQIVLAVTFIALVLILLFVRLVNFLRSAHARFSR